jgi:cell division protein FtsB
MAKEPTTDWIRRRAITGFALLVLLYLVVGSVRLIIDNYRVHQAADRLDVELAGIEQHNLELRNLLAYYRTDSYKEKEARARFNYQKPGERVVAVPLPVDEEPTITQTGPETKAATPPSNPEQWVEYFFEHKS